MEGFSERLRSAAKARSMTPRALARTSGVSEFLIRDVLFGRRRSPSPENIERLARALNVPPARLLGWEEAPDQETMSWIAPFLASLKEKAGEHHNKAVSFANWLVRNVEAEPSRDGMLHARGAVVGYLHAGLLSRAEYLDFDRRLDAIEMLFDPDDR